VLKIGGQILLGGKSLEWVKKEKDGSVELTFADSGSCEMQLKFSAENFRRFGEAVSLFTFGKKNEISFDEAKGEVSAEGLSVMLETQAVKFIVPESGRLADDGVLPTIVIQITSDKNDLNSGLGLTLNEAQAAELVERLGMFLEAAKLRRDASKTKTIAAPARTKRTSVPAAA
jgi:hypothetical protein